MSIAFIQPQFAPNLYDLSAMLKADQVVLMDTDTWSRKGRSHRAKLRSVDGTQWINVPVRTEDKKKAIHEVRIDHDEFWTEALWNGILHNYSQAMYFDFLQDEVYADFRRAFEFEKLIDFDLFLFQRICTYLELDIPYTLSGESPELDTTNETVIYQEYDSRNYIRQLDHAHQALPIHPEYRQAWPGFEPECSILDLLMNYGPESYKVIELLN